MELNLIHNEDCRDTMSKIDEKSINVVITSPPYNTSRPGSSLDGACANIRYDDFNDMKSDQEYIDWTTEIFEGFDRVLAEDGVVLYNLSYSSELTHLMWLTIGELIRNTNFTVADCIIWKKPSTSPNSCSPNKLTRIVEFVFVMCRKNEIGSFQMNKEISSTRKTGQIAYKNYFNYLTAPNNDGSVDIHKATYSSELVRKLASLYARKGDVIYDPFMGTGTTAVACVIDGYNYIGSEISKNYVEYAINRIKPYESQISMF